MPPAIPLATYRVQLTADFGFDATAAIVPYLKALGITHLYASPFLKARIILHEQLQQRWFSFVFDKPRQLPWLGALQRMDIVEEG